MAGRIIADRYKPVKDLRGNMSQVLLCIDYLNDEKEVVLKVYNCNTASDKELQKKLFDREAEILESLHHENIVKILNKGFDSEGNYFLVLEKVNGMPLKNVMIKEQLEETIRLKIITQILDALSYSHSKNIIHRDLKPSNILINTGYNVKLIDFAISKLIDSICSDETLCGYASLKYASPEQKLGKDISYRSDIYSLGIIFYEILANRILEGSPSDFSKDIDNDSNLTKEQKSFLLKMIAEKPEERYESLYKAKGDFLKYWAGQLDNDFYQIQLTDTAINKLFSLGFIDSEDKTKARSFIAKDLQKERYINESIYKGEIIDGEYSILGKQLKLICVIDRITQKVFTIKTLIAPNPLQHEKDKEIYSMKIDDIVSVVYEVSDAEDITDINILVDKLRHFRTVNLSKAKTEVDTKNVIDKWKKILDIQREKVIENKRALRYTNIKLIDDLRISLRIANDLEQIPFSEDDLLVMTSKHNVTRSYRIGYYYDYEDGELFIEKLRDADIKEFADSGEISLDNTMVETALYRQERAVKHVQYNECKNPYLGEIIGNPQRARYLSRYNEFDFVSNKIDKSKEASISDALNCEDLYLLQGPPGTGKTTFISELVAQVIRVKPDAKILITSQSNVAVNHAMTKIRELIPDVKMIRVGRKEKISEGIEDFIIEEQIHRWCNDIREKCDMYTNQLKQKLNLDSSVLDRFKLVEEVDRLNKKVYEADNQLESYSNEVEVLDQDINKISEFNKALTAMSDKMITICKTLDDADLAYTIDDFKTQYLNIGLDFLTTIEEIKGLSIKKVEIQNMIDKISSEKEILSNDIEAGMEMLEISDEEELNTYRNELEIKVKKSQAEYEKYAKLERIIDEWLKRLGTEEEFSVIFLKQVTIVGATCLGVANIPSIENITFDYVIIDEAGRATPPEMLVPAVLGRKLILVGDHKQLPPIVDRELKEYIKNEEDLKKYNLEESLFEYLQSRVPDECKGILREQYRMHPSIGGLISEVFYNGELVSGSRAEDKKHCYSKWNKYQVVWLSTSKRDDRGEATIGTTKQNELEARIILDLIKNLDNDFRINGIKKEVAIIAGYEAQKGLLKKWLYPIMEDLQAISLEINTVDAFQGRETDIVIYSIVRSNDKGNIGFLSDMRRLNVALSRAKELLVLIGDHKCVIRKNLINNENPFVNVHKYIINNSENCLLVEV